MIFFFIGAFLDITSDKVSDNMRILFVFSVMLCLSKVVYLVRVFKQLNFLVKMLSFVLNDIVDFMVLFFCILITFAECNHIVKVDISGYGRLPEVWAHLFNIIRCATGDFASINMNETFDLIEKDEDGNAIGYVFSEKMMISMWVIFVISTFLMTMIFMNFIIAVISDSYN